MPVTDDWMPARIIPTAGISGETERERRATSALLAVMTVVPDFAKELLSTMKAPAGSVETFCEVPLEDEAGKNRPDGAIVVTRGKTEWSCLVEVKTRTSELRDEQMGRYLELARKHGFDGVLSISNQIGLAADELPYGLDGRRPGKLKVKHLSWWEILTRAIIWHEHKGISDPEQAWILGQLIAYLQHESSGAMGFSDMGPDWVGVREATASGLLKAQDPRAADIAQRWHQFVRYLCLSLSQALGRTVKAPAASKVQATAKDLASEGVLAATIKVPDAAGPLHLEVDLRAGRVTTSVEVGAPLDKKRAPASINWFLKQLDRDVPNQVVEVAFAGARESRTEKLENVESGDDLVSQSDRTRLPRKFTVQVTRKMGSRRAGSKGFVTGAERQVVDFYREVAQTLKAAQPRAPKLPDPPSDGATASTGPGSPPSGPNESAQPLSQLAEQRVVESSEGGSYVGS